MQTTINAILAPFKAKGIDSGAEQIGNLWQIWIGDHAGARKNGVELARELAGRRLRDTRPAAPYVPEPEVMAMPRPASAYTAPPEPVEIPRFLRDDIEAEALRAEVAALKAQMAAAAAAKATPPEVSETLSAYGLKPADSYERVNETLVQALAKAKGSAELARGYGGAFDGKSVVEWERKAQSINESIRWNSGRKVETI